MTRRKITFDATKSYNAEIAGRTALYRLYDASERLLYVGISVNLDQRWDSHSRSKLWWHLVVRKHVEWFDTRVEALVAEEEAERTERPRFCDTRRLGGGWTRHPRTEDPSLKQGIIDAAARLRRSLLAGEYQPGERVPQDRELAEAYGVSIAMARSAMEMLRKERLLDQASVGCVFTWVAAERTAA